MTCCCQNAFVEQLGSDFDVSSMLVVDFMHKFELGVWKALFVHLIRILYAAVPAGKLVALLDERYVQSFRIYKASSHISQILADALIQPGSHP